MDDDATLGRLWDWHHLTRTDPPGPPLPIVEYVAKRVDKADRVLYVGYGDGRNASALLRAGLDIYSCDVSVYAIGLARKDSPGLEHRFECTSAVDSFTAVPTFDHVVLSRVMIHDSYAASRSRVRGIVERLRTGGHL
jgi:2-polyprenyl-3-methyl-5-hydroxy-6-metoxy-1,4-benzoquinol methylase